MRWGLLGTSRVSRHLIPLLHQLDGHEPVAVASRSPARAEQFARQWNIARALSPYEALLNDREVEVVYNALPNSLHAEWTIAALRAGKHVLCEKPLATRAADVDAIVDAARAAGRAATEAFMYRYHAQTARLRSLVADRAVGDVRSVSGEFSFLLNRPADVRLESGLEGGALWDVGCYLTSYARLIMAREPSSVWGWQEIGPSGVDLTFAGLLVFPGSYAPLDCGFRSAYRASIEIVGTEGVLQVPNPFRPGVRERLILARPDGAQTIEVEGRPWFADAVDEMRRLADGQPPTLPLSESRGNVATLEALYRSAREQCWVQPAC
ncbi:MAG: Gfo/Idh/MocA family oxidoreductase [Acidobacteria bacterium]|nr:Gfo/Idh/MocA family oxidoreductase [Acidobacteriota bacterium]